MTPRIAIIGNNTLQAMGLKSVLSEIIPIAEVCAYSTLEDMERAGADSFFHYFVSAQVVLTNPDFFISHRHKTIVLVSQPSTVQQFANFHTLDICQPEYKLIKSILLLHQTSHHGGHDHAFIPPRGESSCALMEISQREAEVLALVVKGYINKEIADKLNISLATVVSHRKNITDKLIKSILLLHQTSHHGGHDHAFIPPHGGASCALMEISQREAEVLALVVKGYINKEIADKLNISLATVVSHRKNITDKLRIKSVSALTIYAVTHGIVSVDEI